MEEWFSPHSHRVQQNLEGSSGSMSLSTKSAFEQPRYLHCTEVDASVYLFQTTDKSESQNGSVQEESYVLFVSGHVHTNRIQPDNRNVPCLHYKAKEWHSAIAFW